MREQQIEEVETPDGHRLNQRARAYAPRLLFDERGHLRVGDRERQVYVSAGDKQRLHELQRRLANSGDERRPTVGGVGVEQKRATIVGAVVAVEIAQRQAKLQTRCSRKFARALTRL